MNITIQKSDVFAEVSKTTAYEGAKAGTFDNVYAKTEDQNMLDRYWCEASAAVTETLKDFITSITEPTPGSATGSYTATLTMPANFDSNVETALANSIYTFFCNYIIAKWLGLQSTEKSAAYMTAADASLQECRSKLYYRKKPTRA